MTTLDQASKINILQVVADGNPGGGTTFVISLVEELLKNNNLALHAVTDSGSYGHKALTGLCTKTFGLDFFKRKLSFSLPLQLSAIIEEVKPDIVHLHGGRAAFQCLLARFMHPRITFIYTVHGYHFVRKNPVARTIGMIAEKLISICMDAVAYVSKGDEAIAKTYRLLNNRSVIIYNGIRPVTVATSTDKRFDVVFVGRMVRQKNPELAIEIFKQLNDNGYRFAMVGGGEKEAEIKHMIGNTGQIEFFGAQTHAETLDILRSAKIILLPSRWEGLPLTLLEAMQFGIPAIVSNVTGNNEVIADGLNGHVIDDEDATAYAIKIKTLLNDANLYNRQSLAARKIFAEKYQMERCAQQYAQLYQDVMTQKASA